MEEEKNRTNINPAKILERALIGAAKKARKLEKDTGRYIKPGYSGDISTIADLEIEKDIIGTFTASGISAKIISEEVGRLDINTSEEKTEPKTYPRTTPDYMITIDPLDGSNNFSHAKDILPHCTTIAIFNIKNKKEGESPRFRDIVCAGTIEHNSGNIWFAESGKKTTFNKKETAISKKTSIDQKGKYMIDMFFKKNWDIFRPLIEIKEKINIIDIGSSSMDYALISSGHVDAVMNASQKAHELAPGYLLARQAGIILTDFEKNPLDDKEYDFDAKYPVIAACTKELHDEIIDCIRHNPANIRNI